MGFKRAYFFFCIGFIFLAGATTVWAQSTGGFLCRDHFVQPSLRSDSAFDRLAKSSSALGENVRRNEFEIEARMSRSSKSPFLPVNMTAQMRGFRDRYLPVLANPVIREATTRLFEVSLRTRSVLLQTAIKNSNSKSNYDVVIVGAGIHGLVALHSILSVNPNLKVLIIDEGDTAASVFRYGKAFYINSSSRASSFDSRPLPGEGNINELPGFPIQVTDLSALKYPTANDLGTAAVSGLYAAVMEYPFVDVMFNANAKKLKANSTNVDFSEAVVVKTESFGEMTIEAQVILISTGLGTPKKTTRQIREKLSAPNQYTSWRGDLPPKVLTFEDIIRIIAMSNDPLKFFSDKKIAVVGSGDSANVFIEFLLGLGPSDSYGRSTAQSGRPRVIHWAGQKKVTCDDFIKDIRGRYYQISSGFRSSAKSLDALIKPNPSKLIDISTSSDGQVDAILDSGESIKNLDYLVLTTGFEQNVRSLFQEITNNRSSQFNSDSDFFQTAFTTIRSKTSTSTGVVKVGQQFPNRGIFVVGTAAGDLAEPGELVGIIQNYVSIFNNAPRSQSISSLAVQSLVPKAGGITTTTINLGHNPNTTRRFIVTDIQETRYMEGQSIGFLNAALAEVVSYVRISVDLSTTAFQFRVSKLESDSNLEVESLTNDVDIEPLINTLANVREFFSLANEILKFLPNKALLFTVEKNVNESSGFQVNVEFAPRVQPTSQVSESIIGSRTEVKNNAIALRGLLVDLHASPSIMNGKIASERKSYGPFSRVVRETYAGIKNFVDRLATDTSTRNLVVEPQEDLKYVIENLDISSFRTTKSRFSRNGSYLFKWIEESRDSFERRDTKRLVIFDLEGKRSYGELQKLFDPDLFVSASGTALARLGIDRNSSEKTLEIWSIEQSQYGFMEVLKGVIPVNDKVSRAFQSVDEQFVLLQTQAGLRVIFLDAAKIVTSIGFSYTKFINANANSKLQDLAIATSRNVELRNLLSNEVITSHDLPFDIISAQFSLDNQFAFLQNSQGLYYRLEIRTGRMDEVPRSNLSNSRPLFTQDGTTVVWLEESKPLSDRVLALGPVTRKRMMVYQIGSRRKLVDQEFIGQFAFNADFGIMAFVQITGVSQDQPKESYSRRVKHEMVILDLKTSEKKILRETIVIEGEELVNREFSQPTFFAQGRKFAFNVAGSTSTSTKVFKIEEEVNAK